MADVFGLFCRPMMRIIRVMRWPIDEVTAGEFVLQKKYSIFNEPRFCS
jgi:hypothetical protein